MTAAGRGCDRRGTPAGLPSQFPNESRGVGDSRAAAPVGAAARRRGCRLRGGREGMADAAEQPVALALGVLDAAADRPGEAEIAVPLGGLQLVVKLVDAQRAAFELFPNMVGHQKCSRVFIA